MYLLCRDLSAQPCCLHSLFPSNGSILSCLTLDENLFCRYFTLLGRYLDMFLSCEPSRTFQAYVLSGGLQRSVSESCGFRSGFSDNSLTIVVLVLFRNSVVCCPSRIISGGNAIEGCLIFRKPCSLGFPVSLVESLSLSRDRECKISPS